MEDYLAIVERAQSLDLVLWFANTSLSADRVYDAPASAKTM
jgi:hypothetical protein